MGVQGKVRVARERKRVHRERVQQLLCFNLAGRCARGRQLRQTVGNKEDEDDEQAVGGALDLEVAEERVRAEEVEGLVDDVRRVRVGCGASAGPRAAHAQSDDAPSGAGPRILVLIGRMERLPTWRTSGSSLSEEW